MLMNKKILIFPIEIKVRELLPKMYLAYQLLRRIKNIKIVIGGSRFITQKFSYNDCIWFDKNTHYKQREKHPIHLNNFMLMLDEEGPISFHHKKLIKERYSPQIISQIDHFLFAGVYDFSKLSIKKKIKNFTISGNPKFDLLKDKSIFKNEVNNIKKKYKNIIFIPGHTNHFDESVRIKKESHYILSNNNNKTYVNKHVAQRQNAFNIIKKNYFSLLESVKVIAEKNPNLTVIFRKHPSESSDFINKYFKERPKNLKIVYKYSITPWIISCKYYLHSGCQSVLEAAYLKKKILTYMPFSTSNLKNYKFFSPNFVNQKNLLKFLLKNIDNKKKYNYKNLTKICKNLDTKNYFYKIFLDQINIFCKNTNSSFEPIYQNKNLKYIWLKFIRSILSKLKNYVNKFEFVKILLPYQYLLTKKQKLNKFDKLSFLEIKNILKKFNYGRKINNISIKKLSESTFLLSN